MKKVIRSAIILVCALIAGKGVLFAEPLPAELAQEERFALGLGLEWNMNSRRNFGGAAVTGFDYSFNDFAVGLKFTVSYNFNNITVLEPKALFRWYFFGNIFAQADIGASFILEQIQNTPMFLGGLRGGIRIPLGEMLFIEPYGRFGYPFAFGFGAITGIRW